MAREGARTVSEGEMGPDAWMEMQCGQGLGRAWGRTGPVRAREVTG